MTNIGKEFYIIIIIFETSIYITLKIQINESKIITIV